jgi:hypothetical protein
MTTRNRPVLADIITATSGYAQSDGPYEVRPGPGFVPEPVRRSYLAAALAGVELGAYDVRIVDWLAQWDDYTARLVVSLLVRARRAGYAEAASGIPVTPPSRIDSESWTCRGCVGRLIGRRPADDRCPDCAPGHPVPSQHGVPVALSASPGVTP